MWQYQIQKQIYLYVSNVFCGLRGRNFYQGVISALVLDSAGQVNK